MNIPWIDVLSVVTPVLVTVAGLYGKAISDRNALAQEAAIAGVQTSLEGSINDVKDELTKSISNIKTDMTKNSEADKWRDKEILRLDREQQAIKDKLDTLNFKN